MLFSRVSSISSRTYSTAAAGKVYVVEGKRTPFGKFGGSLMDMTPNQLAIHAGKATLEAAKIDPTHIGHVIYGNVVNSTTDTIYGSRHTALGVGAKIETPAYNVNRLCGSGIQAIIDAKNMINRGEADVVLVVGSENMSMIPHATYGTRFGTRFQAYKVVDFLMDALTDQYCGTPMAITAEDLGKNYAITRDEVDEFSLQSHLKAAAAFKDGSLDGEIAPIELKKKTVSMDEHIRPDASLADMNKLRSVFIKDGLVTAASASGIVDGAAATVVVSEAYAKKHGVPVIAEVGASAVVGVDPKLMGFGPVPAIRQVLEKTGQKLEDIDLVEINEAFAAQVLAVSKELGLPLEKLNIWGGATAIGHPLGASGVRIANTLARQLTATGKKQGIASACIGGGQGIALQLLRVEE